MKETIPEDLDRDVVALARSAGTLRLAIGDGLRRLRETGAYLELGFSSLGGYAFERLGRKRRWAEDAARVATRVAELPRLRAALERGELGWSMVELLARHAMADNEAELVAEAATSTVRGMRERLANGDDPDDGGDGVDGGDSDEHERRTLQITVDRETSWAYELTRSLIRMRFGAANDDAVLEALLAEASSTLIGRYPKLAGCVTATRRQEASDQVRELERRLAELNAEDRFLGGAEDAALTELIASWNDDLPRVDLPRDPASLDAHLRDLSARLQSRDRRLGELARELWRREGWHELGYASASQYANERLGCSLASVKARMTLARRCELLPEIAHALEDGQLGFEAARLVSRVADRDTVDAWLDRAVERTVEHLREEIDAVEACARAEGLNPVGATPPDEAVVADFHALERGMLDGTLADLLVNGGPLPTAASQISEAAEGGGGQISEAAEGGGGQISEVAEGDGGQISEVAEGGGGQMSVDPLGRGRGAGKVPLRFWLSGDMVAYWRDVRRLFDASGEAGDFVDFLIRTFWHVWLRRDQHGVAYIDVYERERFRCASPVCQNRDLTPHHLRFRSRGGGDERFNLVGLCVTCHLELLHQGRMRAEPPAHHVRWTLGRAGLLVVEGRRLVR